MRKSSRLRKAIKTTHWQPLPLDEYRLLLDTRGWPHNSKRTVLLVHLHGLNASLVGSTTVSQLLRQTDSSSRVSQVPEDHFTLLTSLRVHLPDVAL